MKRTLAIITAAARLGPMALAFSGGSDSLVVLDILHRHTPHRPPLVYVDPGLDYPGTREHCQAVANLYACPLHVAEPRRSYRRQWERYGYPMLGKQPARKWTKEHPDAGFRLDCSACCQQLKIAPGRRATRHLGAKVQLTGLRGAGESALRGLRDLQDGALHWVKTDKLWVANPLSGWTDLMVRRYLEQHQLPQHPARAAGAQTIGCVPCGGGAQFTSSAYAQMRRAAPDLWRRWIVEERLGPIILAVKHDAPLAQVEAALARLGGLEQVATERPWVFDFARPTPLPGNTK